MYIVIFKVTVTCW